VTTTACVDCGIETAPPDPRNAEQYMVTDELWAMAGMQPFGGHLCVGRLERRLGRTLTRADFTDAPVNTWRHWHSQRLHDRLTTR
jgi:hypothetical protein